VADHLWLVDRTGHLHTGAPEDLVHAGLIGEVFDTPLAAFDPAAGVFTLRQEARATVHLAAPAALLPLLERALLREGRTTTPDSRPDGITVRADSTGRYVLYVLTRPGRAPSTHHSVADLLRALRQDPPPDPPRQAP
jgi:iron complex transport system ATP-binding protein